MAAPAPAPAAAAAPAVATSSLFVGDLDKDVQEAQLFDLFSKVGPVLSIRVCRDVLTRRSLGYGYVNFQLAADAARAIEQLNLTSPVPGSKPMRVLTSQRDPSVRRSGVGNIFIKNLDATVDAKTLHDTFAQFGTIVSAKVATDAAGKSKGHAFVQFDSAEAAATAIEKVNGMLLADKQVFVGPFVRRQERSAGVSAFVNVFVKNLPEDVDDAKLRELFAPHGAISSAVVMREADGKSKCFGFVAFEAPEAAAAAVAALNDSEVGGKQLTVTRAQKKAEREAELRAKYEAERRERERATEGTNLYIKNLDDAVDEDKLRELFAPCGTVTSCKLMKEARDGGEKVSRGAGFVAFATAEEATRAVTEMNGKMVGSKPLYVALAQRKDDRRARLQAQFAARVQMGAAMGGGMPLYLPPGAPMYYAGMPGAPPQFGGFPPAMMGPGAGMRGQPMGMMPGMYGGMAPGGMGPQGRQGMGGGRMPGGGGIGGRRGPAQQGMMPGRGMPPPQQQQQQQARAPGGRGVMAGAAAPAEPANPTALLASQLASATPDQQRMFLGEALYPMVETIERASAAKITGMLLELEPGEVLHLIESPDALRAKVGEALEVLQQAQAAGAV